ncbi:MAG TPA: hypothetical protein VF815_46145 [Myxococcaceae bacterium]|jgi:hypothetical protein
MFMLLSGLAACGEERPPEGNGNQKVLYIKYPTYLPAAGLWTRIEIPNRRVYLPEGERPNADKQVAFWDFEGATLELDAPPGFEFEVIPVRDSDSSAEAQDFRTRNQADAGFIVRVKCGAVPNASHELFAWVREGGRVRYHDTFDMTCHRVTRLEVEGLADGRYFVGGKSLADITLTAPSALGSARVWGEDLTVTDRRGAFRVDTFLPNPHRQVVLLEAVKPGTVPELAFQNLLYKPAIEVVQDDGWKIELGPAQPKSDGGTAQQWILPLLARGSDGGELKGLYGCAWNITLRDGSTYEATGCQPRETPGNPSRACVTANGRTGCRDY